MSKIKISILCFGVLLLIFWYSIIDKTNSIYDTSYDSETYESISLYNGDGVTQSFHVKEETLDGISIKIGAIGDQNNIFLEYKLYDTDGEKILRKGEFSLEKLESGKFFDVFFESINNCKDSMLKLDLCVKKANGEDGVNLFVTPKENDNVLVNNENHEMLDETLVLRTLTHRFDFETFFVTICFVLYIIFFMKWMYKLFK